MRYHNTKLRKVWLVGEGSSRYEPSLRLIFKHRRHMKLNILIEKINSHEDPDMRRYCADMLRAFIFGVLPSSPLGSLDSTSSPLSPPTTTFTTLTIGPHSNTPGSLSSTISLNALSALSCKRYSTPLTH